MGLGISIRLDGAPDETSASAVFVEVTERVGQATHYRLEYNLDIAEDDFPLLKDSKLGQRETDLAFVRRLARRNGDLFWLSCDETGVETAHFKRPQLEGEARCDLVINLTDPRSNVTNLDIYWDVERPTKADATEVDL